MKTLKAAMEFVKVREGNVKKEILQNSRVQTKKLLRSPTRRQQQHLAPWGNKARDSAFEIIQMAVGPLETQGPKRRPLLQ